jgi:hypothetical protein
LGDYQKPPRKSLKEKRDATYNQEILQVIDRDNVQTAANVARIIGEEEVIKQFNHKPGTVYEYTRIQMRLLFGHEPLGGGTAGMIMEKIWCRLDREHNIYIPLTDCEIEKFYALLRRVRDTSTEQELEIYNDYAIKLITFEEMSKMLGKIGFENYLDARKLFNNIYGYFPVKVPVYGIKEKDYLSFE